MDELLSRQLPHSRKPARQARNAMKRKKAESPLQNTKEDKQKNRLDAACFAFIDFVTYLCYIIVIMKG